MKAARTLVNKWRCKKVDLTVIQSNYQLVVKRWSLNFSHEVYLGLETIELC